MFTFTFTKSSPSTCAECRSLGSGNLKSKSKLDKKTIGRPQEYEWPAFQPQPQPKPRHQVILLSQEKIDDLVRKGLGAPLISLHDAKSREELVRASFVDISLNATSTRAQLKTSAGRLG